MSKNTTRFCKRAGSPIILAFAGQSDMVGTLSAAPLTKPANVTYYLNGVLTGAWPALVGPVAEAADELVNVLGVSSPITLVERSITSTAIQSWLITHFPNLITDFATSGWPVSLLWWQGGADATSPSTADVYLSKLLDVSALMRRDRGAGLGWHIAGLTIDPAQEPSYPGYQTVRQAMVTHCNTGAGYQFIDTDGLPIQPDGLHAERPKTSHVGRTFIRQLRSNGIL